MPILLCCGNLRLCAVQFLFSFDAERNECGNAENADDDDGYRVREDNGGSGAPCAGNCLGDRRIKCRISCGNVSQDLIEGDGIVRNENQENTRDDRGNAHEEEGSSEVEAENNHNDEEDEGDCGEKRIHDGVLDFDVLKQIADDNGIEMDTKQ